ncbi:MAG: sialate O-acetylesterase [Alistipes sp.]|nr:sialate O-acetylesterase [Alistipes sp.]
MKLQKWIFIAVAMVWAWSSEAAIKLPAFFMDNMVLQQQTDAPVWGWATPKKEVRVAPSWTDEVYTTRADKEGRWKVSIPTPKAGGPYEIRLSDGEELTLKNVMLGEVWICAGQSNMEMPMKGFKNQPVENGNLDAARGTNPNIRLFTVKRNAQIAEVEDVVGKWEEARPLSIRDFSATAYYFGRMVEEVIDVPVGLICVAWGGSACEAWMTPDMLAPFKQVTLPKTQQEVDKTQQRCPTALWNGMLRPLVGMAIRGAIWYQGCDNWNRAYYYADLNAAMIRGWREKWGIGDFPFYYCQIAPFDYDIITAVGQPRYNSAYLREQQAKVEHMVPNTGMAVLLDVGMERGIHPYDKQTPGERLALHALAKTYGIEGIYCDAPILKEVEFKGDVVEVSFDRSSMWISCKHGFESKCFEVAGEDRVFYPAKAEVKQKKMIVRSEQVKKPVAVRYGFKDWVVGDLYGSDGLPISSFRSDDWADPAPIKEK